ncbi:AlpA family transcriptional regulator [Alcanivorax sp.]|jgi:prophage regulatory protein|uniref:helix-turn-helix transcriptional regulator n=1 Tax=Alcanivorax sp. TaxID=1872427 RepID=UPI002612B29C|nr:AlpA family phage regulatory protein [Alcanivorax sp.]
MSISSQSPRSLRVLRRPEVEQLTGQSRSKIYAMMSEASPYYDPDWPKPIRLGARSVGWLEHEVMAWIDSRRDALACSIRKQAGGVR